MKRHTSPSVRRSLRVLPQVAIAGAVLLLAVFTFLFFKTTFRLPLYRESLLLTGDPTRIISVHADGAVTIATIPQDTLIRAVEGYGNYSIRALSELDRIDNKGGLLIKNSVADALGIPIVHYLGSAPDGVADSTTLIRNVFSWGGLMERVKGSPSSMPFSEWIRYVWILRFIPADKVETISLDGALTQETTPDGRVVRVLDENKLDYLLATMLFDTGLRAEGLTVAVYNTTDVPLVGLRAARMLSRMGLQLVFVGNAQHSSEDCQVVVSKAEQGTKTVRFIREYFHCTVVDPQGISIGRETGADVIVLLGKEFSSKYQ